MLSFTRFDLSGGGDSVQERPGGAINPAALSRTRSKSGTSDSAEASAMQSSCTSFQLTSWVCLSGRRARASRMKTARGGVAQRHKHPRSRADGGSPRSSALSIAVRIPSFPSRHRGIYVMFYAAVALRKVERMLHRIRLERPHSTMVQSHRRSNATLRRRREHRALEKAQSRWRHAWGWLCLALPAKSSCFCGSHGASKSRARTNGLTRRLIPLNCRRHICYPHVLQSL